MKNTTKSKGSRQTTTTARHNGHACPTPAATARVHEDAAVGLTPEQIEAFNYRQRCEESIRRQAIEDELLAGIAPVYFYEDYGHVGFGFRAGKLVEWSIPSGNNPQKISEEAREDEISLLESLKWISAMRFADKRFNICLQTGPGLDRWIEDLRFKLEDCEQNDEAIRQRSANA